MDVGRLSRIFRRQHEGPMQSWPPAYADDMGRRSLRKSQADPPHASRAAPCAHAPPPEPLYRRHVRRSRRPRHGPRGAVLAAERHLYPGAAAAGNVHDDAAGGGRAAVRCAAGEAGSQGRRWGDRKIGNRLGIGSFVGGRPGVAEGPEVREQIRPHSTEFGQILLACAQLLEIARGARTP